MRNAGTKKTSSSPWNSRHWRSTPGAERENGSTSEARDFNPIDKRNRLAECGLFIGVKKYWGKGYGTDALLTLLRYGFDTLNFNRIQLCVMAFNQRAIHVYEKIGFVREGTQREAHFYKGQYWDMHHYSILRREWEARYGASKE